MHPFDVIMKKYQQLLIAALGLLSFISFLIYKHEYDRLRNVLEVLEVFGSPPPPHSHKMGEQLVGEAPQGGGAGGGGRRRPEPGAAPLEKLNDLEVDQFKNSGEVFDPDPDFRDDTAKDKDNLKVS